MRATKNGGAHCKFRLSETRANIPEKYFDRSPEDLEERNRGPPLDRGSPYTVLRGRQRSNAPLLPDRLQVTCALTNLFSARKYLLRVAA